MRAGYVDLHHPGIGLLIMIASLAAVTAGLIWMFE
jgi:hypothetical protein